MTHSLVIGGTRGVGAELVRLLAARGDRVSAVGRSGSPDRNGRVANVTYEAVDVSNDDAADSLKKLIQKNGKISHLMFLQRFRGEGEKWFGEIDVSLTATRKLIEELSPEFYPEGDKSITLVGSIAHEFIAEEQPAGYHIAKAGLIQMARYYAVKLGKQRIRVNSVSPSTFVKTESEEFYANQKELLSLFERMVPLGRIGRAVDTANVIEFLSSPKASFLTGQNIMVDGGVSLLSQESLARSITGL